MQDCHFSLRCPWKDLNVLEIFYVHEMSLKFLDISYCPSNALEIYENIKSFALSFLFLKLCKLCNSLINNYFMIQILPLTQILPYNFNFAYAYCSECT